MGTTPSKATKQLNNVTNNFAPTKTRLSKRILKRNSAIYPSSTNSKILDVSEKNNNSASAILTSKDHDSTVVVNLRNKSENEAASKHSNESISNLSTENQRVSVKRDSKKKKKVDSAASKESVSTYHQTNYCYFKLDDGKFLKLPSDTKHKSSDGCYVKQTNGSFRHINFNAENSANHESADATKSSSRKEALNSSQKSHDKENVPNPNHNRKVLVTMIDAGLPVVAISKRDKTSSVKKEKLKVFLFELFLVMLRVKWKFKTKIIAYKLGTFFFVEGNRRNQRPNDRENQKSVSFTSVHLIFMSSLSSSFVDYLYQSCVYRINFCERVSHSGFTHFLSSSLVSTPSVCCSYVIIKPVLDFVQP